MNTPLQELIRTVAQNDKGEKIYGVFPYKNTDCYSWFSHWNGNSRECRFLFENRFLEQKGFKITGTENFKK